MTKTLSEYFNQRYFDLLWALTQKEFKIRYKRATLGLLWTIVNPLAQMLIIGFVFSLFINIPNHHLFLLSGLIPWQFFSNSISRT